MIGIPDVGIFSPKEMAHMLPHLGLPPPLPPSFDYGVQQEFECTHGAKLGRDGETRTREDVLVPNEAA